MKKERLEGLSDGIFAIVMTLLVIEIRVPELHGAVTPPELFHAVSEMYPLFLSYILSFALLFTYWRAHNSYISVYARNIDTVLANYNALFFLFVALVPFSAHLLGSYNDNQFAVVVIGLNTVFIALALLMMRNYIVRAETIDNEAFTGRSWRHSNIRTLVPVACAFLAMFLSFLDITAALTLFTVAVLFNLMPYSADLVDKIFFRKYLDTDKNGLG